jgi:hypothetical protein
VQHKYQSQSPNNMPMSTADNQIGCCTAHCRAIALHPALSSAHQAPFNAKPNSLYLRTTFSPPQQRCCVRAQHPLRHLYVNNARTGGRRRNKTRTLTQRQQRNEMTTWGRRDDDATGLQQGISTPVLQARWNTRRDEDLSHGAPLPSATPDQWLVQDQVHCPGALARPRGRQPRR